MSEFLGYAQSILALTNGEVTHAMLGQVAKRVVTGNSARYILEDDGSPLYNLCLIVVSSLHSAWYMDTVVDGIVEPRYVISWEDFLKSYYDSDARAKNWG